MSEQLPPDSKGADGLDDVFARVEKDIEAERGIAAELRALPRGRATALVFGAVLGLVGGWLWLLPRPDLGLYPKARLALELAALALLAMSAGWTFVRPLSKADPRPGGVWARLVAHVLVAAAIVSAPAAHLTEPFASGGGGPQWWAAAGACLAVGSSAALPVLLLLLALDRGGRAGSLLWLAPFAAWLVGMAVLQTHCPLLVHQHQWAGHFGVLVPVVLVWLLLRGRGIGE